MRPVQRRQVPDRFHLLRNLRYTIEQQLSHAPPPYGYFAPPETVDISEPPGFSHRYGQPEVTEHLRLVKAGRRARSRQGFDPVRALYAEGRTLGAIARETGFIWRTVASERSWTN
jgi:hypothetical protein